jgi:hypothetical protein
MPKPGKRPGPSVLGWVLCALGAVTIALLLIGYFYFEIDKADGLWEGIIGGVVVGILVPMVWYLGFASRGVSLISMQSENAAGSIITFYPNHEEVDWDAIIRGSRSLDIIVHYYGRWARIHEQAFIDFFKRGGTLRLVMADPEIKATLATVHSHFFDNLGRAELRSKILETETIFRGLLADAGSRTASLGIYYFPKALHYSGVLSDNRTLYLSVYEQFRGRNIRSSVFGIDLRKDRELEKYWLENRDQFIDQSRQSP